MLVKELIEVLQTVNPELTVDISYDNGCGGNVLEKWKIAVNDEFIVLAADDVDSYIGRGEWEKLYPNEPDDPEVIHQRLYAEKHLVEFTLPTDLTTDQKQALNGGLKYTWKEMFNNSNEDVEAAEHRFERLKIEKCITLVVNGYYDSSRSKYYYDKCGLTYRKIG